MRFLTLKKALGALFMLLLMVALAVPLVGAATETPPNGPPKPPPARERGGDAPSATVHCVIGNPEYVEETLAELVELGIISQEQADKIAEHLKSKAEVQCVAGRLLNHFEIIAATADLTGMQLLDLVQQLQDGTSLAEIAEEHGVSEQALKDELMGVAQENGAELVADGEASQETVDAALEIVEGQIDEGIHRDGMYYRYPIGGEGAVWHMTHPAEASGEGDSWHTTHPAEAGSVD